MTITHKLTLDLQHKGKMQRIDVVQGDAFTRQVDLVLENGGKPWLFPICEPVARYCKPDGTMGVYDTLPTGEPAFSYAGNILTLVLAPQMLTCRGVVQVQVEMNAQDLKLATFTFLVAVEPGVALCGESEDYVNWTKVFLPQTTGAKVGQFLQISKVDDAGRITEMAPADDPAEEATNKAYEALRIANDVAQEIKAYSPSGTRSIAEAAMRMASGRLVAPRSASVGQYFRVKEVDTNGVVTAVEAVDAPGSGNGSDSSQNVNGLSTTAANLLITILRNVVYSTDQSANITALETALGSSGGGGNEEPDTPDVPDVPVVNTYTITAELVNVTSNNSATSVNESASYTATLTAADGYELDNVTVIMGGVDITATAYSNGVVTIAAVTGNVVITATAVTVESGDDSGNDESEIITVTNWTDGKNINNGEIVSFATRTVSDPVDVTDFNTIVVTTESKGWFPVIRCYDAATLSSIENNENASYMGGAYAMEVSFDVSAVESVRFTMGIDDTEKVTIKGVR